MCFRDRILARLLVVAPDRRVMTSGLALDFRLREKARATNDLDLGRQDNQMAATDDFLAMQTLRRHK